ncbi:hypothetical protein GUITHDRAFT_110028 [Guillardia theta CCMP2712]|uniref:Uncharacterized protein n=1 Tax=Guillardia theta (strain CCMP2712) TaxID=905079 RepID=L1J5Y4_GUITC|nr:hypothetical protein GUITHDRAFT_110028 [Guillardia theta CCMP2712]EKX43916.1 hypothetical protein GUITHDRAFT_110028 [Guillardia theta CCMP2712]|eukprot:XP_005830896.1 hypothetical protein GUITHDRAFT_110028 [Guillardia theta CCMP2712]
MLSFEERIRRYVKKSKNKTIKKDTLDFISEILKRFLDRLIDRSLQIMEECRRKSFKGRVICNGTVYMIPTFLIEFGVSQHTCDVTASYERMLEKGLTELEALKRARGMAFNVDMYKEIIESKAKNNIRVKMDAYIVLDATMKYAINTLFDEIQSGCSRSDVSDAIIREMLLRYILGPFIDLKPTPYKRTRIVSEYDILDDKSQDQLMKNNHHDMIRLGRGTHAMIKENVVAYMDEVMRAVLDVSEGKEVLGVEDCISGINQKNIRIEMVNDMRIVIENAKKHKYGYTPESYEELKSFTDEILKTYGCEVILDEEAKWLIYCIYKEYLFRLFEAITDIVLMENLDVARRKDVMFVIECQK